MCGRVYNTLNPNQLLRLAGTRMIKNQEKHSTSYNMGPMQYVPTIRHNSDKENNCRELDYVKWGYQAPFGQLIINARVEEAHEKRTFKPLLNKARCVMVVDGYFEWTPKKVPYVFKGHVTNDEEKLNHLYIAALIAPDNTLILLTREAMKGYDSVHDRMPVFLDESELDIWLDYENYKFEDIINSEILNEKKSKWSGIEYYEVGPLISNIKNKSEQVILPVKEYKKELDKTGIKKFFGAVSKKKEAEETKEQSKSQMSTQAATQITNIGSQEAKSDDAAQARKEASLNNSPAGKVKTDAEIAEEEAKKKGGLHNFFNKSDKESKKRKEATNSQDLQKDDLKKSKKTLD